MRAVEIGRQGQFRRRVQADDSADRFGNTGVEVLGTPVLCYWFETAAVIAIHELLEPGEATVGTRLTIEHLKATPLGMEVTVDAEVVGVEGRRISFAVEARDEKELIARGTHERFVIHLDRFLEAVRQKS